MEAHHQQTERAVGHRISSGARPDPCRCQDRGAHYTGRAVRDRVRAGFRALRYHVRVGQGPLLRSSGEEVVHLDFAVVADYALVDQSGKMSVLGIFQHIWVQQFPAMHPRLHLVLRLKGRRTEIGEHAVQIRLVDDAETELLGGSGTVNFAEPPAGVTEIEAAAVLVFDVPFPHAGQYRFEITVDGERKANVPITVSQMPPPTVPAQPRSEEHTSELQSRELISYAVFCLKKKKKNSYIHLKIDLQKKTKNKILK